MTRKVVLVGGRPDMAAAAIAAINAGGEIVAVHADERPGWIDIPIADIMADARRADEVVFSYDPGEGPIDQFERLCDRIFDGAPKSRGEYRWPPEPTPLPPSTDTRQQRRYRARKGIR